MSSVPVRSGIPHAPRPHNSSDVTSGGGAPASRKTGGRKHVPSSTAYNTSSHSALPSSTKTAHHSASSNANSQNRGEAMRSESDAVAAEELANAQRMLDMLAKERSFMMNLLDQAKQERQELIDSIAQRDAAIQRKDAELAKLAQRFKAEEQAFRETMAMELDRMEEQRLRDGRQGRLRDQLLAESVEVLVAAEVFSAVSGGYIKHILKIIQAMPITRTAAEDACNRFISGQDTTSSQKQHAGYLLNLIIAECSAFETKKLKAETARQLRRKGKKGKKPVPSASEIDHDTAEESLDEEGDELGRHSVPSSSPVYAYAANMTVGPPRPAMPPFYDVNLTSDPNMSSSPNNRNRSLISNLMNVVSAGRYMINNSNLNTNGGPDPGSDGESSNYSKLLDENTEANYSHTGIRASPKADNAARDASLASVSSYAYNASSAANASAGTSIEPADSARSPLRNPAGSPTSDEAVPSPSPSICGPDPIMNSCFPMFSSRSPAPSNGPKTSIVSTNYRKPSAAASGYDSSGSVALGDEDYCVSDASSDSSVASNKSASKPNKEYWWKSG